MTALSAGAGPDAGRDPETGRGQDAGRGPDMETSGARAVELPGPVNAHSHAFHRLLRGRTHARGPASGPDSFWTWRTQMYRYADRLDPAAYRDLATAVYAELAAAGYTAVGEFHYLHHTPGAREHAMALALADAALDVGIRLTLLDACYLQGGLDSGGRVLPLSPEQARFADADAAAWARRHRSLRAALAERAAASGRGRRGLLRLGAAVHSVRAVPAAALPTIAAALDPGEPLHAHVSEQPAENAACEAAYGCTPTELFARAGLLGPHFTAVHATHLTPGDIALLGGARANVALCPTTEADLGDGIGPARALADAGAVLGLGSDQHAVVDPFLEMRALEHGERLASGQRARFTPEQLTAAAADGGRRALGLPQTAAADRILVDAGSVRTAGSAPGQLPMSATAADVLEVQVAGDVIARNGRHVRLGDPAQLYREFFARWPQFRAAAP
ncbi:8-oxoguanine deaminase [Arthrobacter saudimassiliensis]|uniref:8-oxoguanine deaminase n=1 Tax=Arthrobacter saudimassiliensis TaxID=1461584 RepID=A0A078MWB7_9MICC|nr:8-oxoguanine deaminase [Arthrobacter saudimassiliensis]